MRRLSLFTLPLLFLFFTGCADQPTSPDLELTASFGKVKPCQPWPSCNNDDPGGDPPTVANPVLAFDAGSHRNKGGLWVSDADGGNKAQIYNIGGGAYFHPAWSPNGEGTEADPYEILYVANWSVGKVQVYVNADGKPARLGSPEVLSTNVNYVGVEVSPGGDEVLIVWRPIDGSSPRSKLVLTDPDFNSETEVYVSDPDIEIWAAAWSPEGTEVAFLEGSYSTGASLKILTPPNGTPTTVETFSSVDFPPMRISWARTSDQLVFDINGTMYLLDDLSGPGTPVSLGPGYGPVFSPDDSKIVYDTRAGVYVKTLDGSQPDVSIGGQWYSDWRR
jgi:hypothetical protein